MKNFFIICLILHIIHVSEGFKNLDKDKDGTLDKIEGSSHVFEVIDLDKDGSIDAAEFTNFQIKMFDKDNDNKLDHKEAEKIFKKKIFDQIDTDKDGQLESKEIAAYHAYSTQSTTTISHLGMLNYHIVRLL